MVAAGRRRGVCGRDYNGAHRLTYQKLQWRRTACTLLHAKIASPHFANRFQVRKHAAAMLGPALRQRLRCEVERQLPGGKRLCAATIALGAEALEAQRVVAIRFDDAVNPEARLALSARAAQTEDFLRQVMRGFGHCSPPPRVGSGTAMPFDFAQDTPSRSRGGRPYLRPTMSAGYEAPGTD